MGPKRKLSNEADLLEEARRLGVRNLNETKVSLRWKGLGDIPEFVFHMPNLDTLILSNNYMTTLPAEIGNLRNLKQLYIDNNYLTTLPDSIGKLKGLEKLGLENNQLSSLPESVGNLESLKLFLLSGNSLESIPDTMKRLSRNLRVGYKGEMYKIEKFIRLYLLTQNRAFVVNNNTNFMNNAFMNARMNNIPQNRRAFINKESDVKENGSLRRVYNVKGLRTYLSTRPTGGRLHGGDFNINDIVLLKNVPHMIRRSNRNNAGWQLSQ